jgi:dihydrofolate synthase/folylpolyglutamate synthase
VLDSLFALKTNGIKFGLEKTASAAHQLGSPQNTYPCFHVAGTNGKGSVCTFIDAMLRHQGMSTGLFTSPHIIDFEERFVVNGQPVTTDEWLSVFGDIETVATGADMTFFEATTVLAFELFRRAHVDWAVFEVGMGGRLDSTNVVTPRVSVIARIDLDHRDYLGADIVTIAGEKLGIVKPGVPLVMQWNDDAAVRARAEQRCTELSARLAWVRSGDAADVVVGPDSTAFTYKGQRFSTRMRGAFQVLNALTAIRAVEVAGFTDLALLAQGLSGAFVPGRFQVVDVGGRTYVFDVGHNPDAARALSGALATRFPGKSVCVVAGVMHDKDHARVIAQLCSIASTLILTRPHTDRAEDAQVLASEVPAGWPGRVRVAVTVAEAVSLAATEDCDVVCVTGSFYTVGEAMTALGVRPYADSGPPR